MAITDPWTKKGQQTIIGLALIFAGVVVLMALLPFMNNEVEKAAGNLSEAGAEPGAIILVRLIPLFIVLSFIITIFAFTTTQRTG